MYPYREERNQRNGIKEKKSNVYLGRRCTCLVCDIPKNKWRINKNKKGKRTFESNNYFERLRIEARHFR